MTTAPHPLSAAALTDLPAAVAAPSYDRTAVRGAIFHVGVGGFHRAHLATYADELCAAGNLDWGIVGCGVLSFDENERTLLERLPSRRYLPCLSRASPSACRVEAGQK